MQIQRPRLVTISAWLIVIVSFLLILDNTMAQQFGLLSDGYDVGGFPFPLNLLLFLGLVAHLLSGVFMLQGYMWARQLFVASGVAIALDSVLRGNFLFILGFSIYFVPILMALFSARSKVFFENIK